MRENRTYGSAGGETELNRSSLPRSYSKEVLSKSGVEVPFRQNGTTEEWNHSQKLITSLG